MANFVLAGGDVDAVLSDYLAGSATAYLANVPISVSSGVLSASLLTNGTALEQVNLVNTFDGKPETTGTLPKLRLALAGSTLPIITTTDFTLDWILTAGLDGERKSYVSATDLGEKQVNLTGLSVHVASVSDKLLLYANDGQNIQIKAYRSSSNTPITQGVNFSSTDVIGEIRVENGQVFLDLNLMSVVEKLDSLASLFSLFGYTPESLLSTGNYHLSMTGLPLEDASGAISSLSVITPIAAPANQAPQLQAIADQTLDAPVAFSLSASDPEAQAITYSLVSGGSVDTVQATISDNSLTLTPASGYTTTQPIEFIVKASDPNGAYTTQSVSVTVAVTSTARYWGDLLKPISGVALSNGVPQKTTTAADKAAITLSDVLTTLKYYLGKTQLTGYAVQAADYNDDGVTTLSDVLATLKAYLGKSTPPAWEFVPLPDASPVEYVGILKGDVNGSWTPPLDA